MLSEDVGEFPVLRFRIVFVCALILGCMSLAAWADDYAVKLPSKISTTCQVQLVVNDSVVESNGTIINGFTMVPLRPVINAIGGDVQKSKDGKSVLVRTAKHSACVTVGQRRATADQRQVELGTAPSIINGYTCVPLRFFVDSFGARLDWSNNPKIAYLYSEDFGYARQATSDPLVRAVFVSPLRPLVNGDVLNFEVYAAPSSSVYLSVAGVKSDIPAYEERPGRFLASLAIDSTMKATNAKVTAYTYASRKSNGTASRHKVTINEASATTSPDVLTVYPASNSTVFDARPAILIESQRDAFKENTIRLWFDESEYTHQLCSTSNEVAWRPSYNLSKGKHAVCFQAEDVAGHKISCRWYFTVASKQNNIGSSEAAPTILLRVRTPRPCDAVSDVFSVVGRATAGANVTISVVERVGHENGIVAADRAEWTQTVKADLTGRFEAEFDTSTVRSGHRLGIKVQAERDEYPSHEIMFEVVRR